MPIFATASPFGFEPWIAPLADVIRVAEAHKLRYADIVRRAQIALD
jgi:hypothetical protein